MPQQCTCCLHPKYKQIIRALQQGRKRTDVLKEFTSKEHPLSYVALRRCYDENQHHYNSKELTSALNDLQDTEAALRKETKKQAPNLEELNRLRKHKKALREEITKLKAALTTGFQGEGPRLIAGELAGINVNDEDTWPIWLPVFIARYMDAVTEDADRRTAEQNARDYRGGRVAMYLPTRRVKPAMEVVS